MMQQIGTSTATGSSTLRDEARAVVAEAPTRAALYVPGADAGHVSRFGLIGAFCDELRDECGALLERGVACNPAMVEGLRTRVPSVFTFFNFASSSRVIIDWIGPVQHLQGVPLALTQWLIDHPMNLQPQFMQELAVLSGYRLITVADDDVHLLRLCWPKVHHMTIGHGVSARAMVQRSGIEASHAGGGGHGERDIDVLLCGSIANDTDLARLRSQVPQVLHASLDAMVHMRLEHPHLSFGQACDLCLPTPMMCSDHWGLLSAIFRDVTARVNVARRTSVLEQLQGMRVMVVGTRCWQPWIERARARGVDATLMPDVAYADIPLWMARAKVQVALNPTQFVHAFSERLLLSLAGGCATVTDDRIRVRQQLSDCVRSFSPDVTPSGTGGIGEVRVIVEQLLGDADERIKLARRGWDVVAQRHLWRYRIAELFEKLGIRLGHSGAGM